MGGEKKKIEEPWINKITREIQQRPPDDITPFLLSLQSKFGELEKQVISNIETEQAKRLQSLQTALMNAIGSLQYNPYAEKTKQAFEQLRQQKLQPIEQSKSKAISQYTAITPEVSQTLRMAGAYQWAKEHSPPEEKRGMVYKLTGAIPTRKAKDILQYYQPSYESGMQFIQQTKDFLKGLGYQDTEIENVIKPYTSLMQEGYELAGRIYNGNF